MDNIFYSREEKTAFWVAGYCRDLNTDLAQQKVYDMLKNAKKFAKWAGVDVGTVKTYEITQSRRYKHMRMFYADGINEAPKGAFCIGGQREDGSVSDWTMTKWIHD